MIFTAKIALENWQKKYRYKSESELETFIRCAKALAAVEKDPQKWYPLFLQTLLKFNSNKISFDEHDYPDKEPIGLKTTLGGRITANIGTDFKNATLMNCFINGPVSGAKISYKRESEDGSIKYDVNMETSKSPDDLSNIFLTILEQAKTLASEGGYGLNFGFIRPRGALIKGTGIKHPGVLSYMKLWDTVSECMVKGTDDGYVDKLKNYLSEDQISELKNAVKNATRKGAMMGALPCFSKTTNILTDKGWINVVELIERLKNGENIKAIDDKGNSHIISNPIIREPEEIFELELDDGSKIEVTKDHEFEVRNINTNEIYLKALKDIDSQIEEIKIIEKIMIQNLTVSFKKLKAITLKTVDKSYDFTVEKSHRIIAKKTDSKNAFYTSNCNHPDIEEFIKSKQVKGVLTKFNTSVLVDDKFMNAVINDELYDLVFNGVTYKRIKARELYDLMMTSTYNRAEPGILFYDNMHKNNPVSYLGHCNATNPCGEVPGLAAITSVCLLGSLNVTQYVYIDGSGNICFNFDSYKNDITIFARMLDNVNDLANAPLPSYEYVVKKLRQFGMGINGLGSALMMLGIPYNSEKAVQFTKIICEMKENYVLQASALLAKEKGPFEAYDAEKFQNTEYFKSDRLSEETKDLIRKYGVRNAKTTTNPPLGNTSIICNNVSNSIEPVFSLEYERIITCKWPEGLNVENIKHALKYFKEHDFEYWRGEFNGITYYYEPHNRGLCEVNVVRDYGYQWLLDNFPNKDHSAYLTTTRDLKTQDHLNIQEVVQYYCNQSVSKTCNLPKDYPFEDFKQLYIKAWQCGLNGFTTYVEDSMESVMSSLKNARDKKEIVKKDIKLPEVFLNGPCRIIKKEGQKFYLHFSYLPQDTDMKYPICLWIYSNSKEIGMATICNKASRELAKLALEKGVDSVLVQQCIDKAKLDYSYNRLGRMISLCLRHNISTIDILVTLRGIEGDSLSSLLAAVRKFISLTINDGTVIKAIKCEACGSEGTTIMEAGCFKCQSCGSSRCG